jgi:CheY-like chemotaxis protein
MPIKNGLEVIEEIRKDESSRNFRDVIPVIALSAAAMVTDIEKGLKAGCNSYLTKPYNRSELIKLINKYLS